MADWVCVLKRVWCVHVVWRLHLCVECVACLYVICVWGVSVVCLCVYLCVCSVSVCVYVCAGCARAAAPLCPLWSYALRGSVGSRPSQSLSPRAPRLASEPPGPALPVSKPEAEVPAKRSLPGGGGCGGSGGGGGDLRGEAAASCGGRVAVAVPARRPFPRLQQVRARPGGGEGGRGGGSRGRLSPIKRLASVTGPTPRQAGRRERVRT